MNSIKAYCQFTIFCFVCNKVNFVRPKILFKLTLRYLLVFFYTWLKFLTDVRTSGSVSVRVIWPIETSNLSTPSRPTQISANQSPDQSVVGEQVDNPANRENEDSINSSQASSTDHEEASNLSTPSQPTRKAANQSPDQSVEGEQVDPTTTTTTKDKTLYPTERILKVYKQIKKKNKVDFETDDDDSENHDIFYCIKWLNYPYIDSTVYNTREFSITQAGKILVPEYQKIKKDNLMFYLISNSSINFVKTYQEKKKYILKWIVGQNKNKSKISIQTENKV